MIRKRSHYLATRFSILALLPCLLFVLSISLMLSKPLKAQDILIVASPFENFSYYNKSGDVEGTFVKTVQRYMEQTDLTYEIRLLPWTRALRFSEQRDNVLIYSIIRNEKCEDQYHWLYKLGNVTDILITRNQEPWNKMSMRDFIDQEAVAICELNSAQCDMLHQLGFSRDNIIQLSTSNEKTLINMISRERADIVFSTKTDLEILNQQSDRFHMVDKLSTSEFYLAASKNLRADLLDKIKTSPLNKKD